MIVKKDIPIRLEFGMPGNFAWLTPKSLRPFSKKYYTITFEFLDGRTIDLTIEHEEVDRGSFI